MKRLLVAAAILLGSCATADPDQFANQDDATCMSWGLFVGSPDYARCRTALTEQRNQQMAAQNKATSERIAAFGRAMQGVGSAAPAMTPVQPARATTVCFGKGERISGFNKICFYDCLGSAHAETYRSTDLCPLTVNR